MSDWELKVSFVFLTQTLGYDYSYEFMSRFGEVLVKGCSNTTYKLTDFSLGIGYIPIHGLHVSSLQDGFSVNVIPYAHST